MLGYLFHSTYCLCQQRSVLVNLLVIIHTRVHKLAEIHTCKEPACLRMSVTAGPDITIGISADLGRVISVTLIFHPAVAILMVMAYTSFLTSHFGNFILWNRKLRNIDVKRCVFSTSSSPWITAWTQLNCFCNDSWHLYCDDWCPNNVWPKSIRHLMRPRIIPLEWVIQFIATAKH